MNRGLRSYKKLTNKWVGLMLPRFKCGHEKTPGNTYSAGQYTRCKFCHDRRCG